MEVNLKTLTHSVLTPKSRHLLVSLTSPERCKIVQDSLLEDQLHAGLAGFWWNGFRALGCGVEGPRRRKTEKQHALP